MSETSKLLSCHTRDRNCSALLPVNKFSDVHKLFRVTALVLRFIINLRKSSIKNKENFAQEARLYWLKRKQSVHFKDELTFLQNPVKRAVPTLVNNLNLFLDDNHIIRSKGRLDKSSYSYDVRNPILLPKTSFLTELLVWDAHFRCKHLSTATTLSVLRKSGLWIAKGRAVVKSVLNKCITCKKLNSHAFKYPKPTNFLKYRVTFCKPYQHTGVDYTGHVYIKYQNKLTKMYIIVFTCLNIRSVHIELLPSMTCKDFLMCFVRFCNSNTIPDALYSDNASSFINGMNIMSNSVIDNDFTSYLIMNNVKHIRIPLYSAWIGSYWERMIRTIKSCLYKVIGRKHCSYFELITVLSDIQNCINSRPLTYLNEDTLDALTPNSFLKFDTGRSILFGSEAGSEVVMPGRRELVTSLEWREEAVNKFKDSWHSEYILSLREASRDLHQLDWQDVVAEGDIVLISSPTKPRSQWLLGLVKQLLPGSDNKTRTVKVARPDRTEGVYSINLLYPLEISVNPAGSLLTPNDSTTENDESSAKQRPKRRSAVQCLQRIKQCN